MAGVNHNFCLRWENHQSTLIDVFNILLESGTLVDCTLAAEGQYLEAHKVILSACSPFLKLLLSQHNEKHPILILKDVTFQDLKSMMVYMYKGEVKISQNQLSPFLKAAESLQIKGLVNGNKYDAPVTPVVSPILALDKKPVRQAASSGPFTTAQDLMVERRLKRPHDMSTLLTQRKCRCNLYRPSSNDNLDIHIDKSNSCDVSPLQSAVLSVPDYYIHNPIIKCELLDDYTNEADNTYINNYDTSVSEGIMVRPKIEPILIEPKTEYLEEIISEVIVDDLALNDDGDLENSMDILRAGPSHDNSIQNFVQWPTTTGRQTIYKELVSQEKGGRDQGDPIEQSLNEKFKCPNKCGRSYKWKRGLARHLKYRCVVKPKLVCSICQRKFAYKKSFKMHLKNVHRLIDI